MNRLLLLTAALLGSASPLAAQTVAITNGIVATGDGSDPVQGATVIVRNGRVTAVGSRHLDVPHHPVALEDADRARGEVEGGPLPVGDDVGLLDDDLAEVGELLGGDELEDGGRVLGRERSCGEPGGQVEDVHGQQCGGRRSRSTPRSRR